MKRLLAAGAATEVASRCRRETACHFASYFGQLGCLRALIASGCDVNVRNAAGATAALMAAYNGHTHCLKVRFQVHENRRWVAMLGRCIGKASDLGAVVE